MCRWAQMWSLEQVARHGHPRRCAKRNPRKATGLRRSAPGSPRASPPLAALHRAVCGPEDVTATARQEEVVSCPRLSVSRTLVVWGFCSPPVSPARLSPPWRAHRLSTSAQRAHSWFSAAPLSPTQAISSRGSESWASPGHLYSVNFGLPGRRQRRHARRRRCCRSRPRSISRPPITSRPVRPACPAGNDLTGQNLGGLTLTAGAYDFSSSAQLTGQLTLDAAGNPNAQFVFEIGSTLTTASASSIRLINGASPCNVYWQIGSSATLGSTTAFEGNLMAHTSITVNNGSTVQGRVLASTGAVTLDNNVLDGSMCGAATITPPGSTPPATPPVTPPVASGHASGRASDLNNANHKAGTYRTGRDAPAGEPFDGPDPKRARDPHAPEAGAAGIVQRGFHRDCARP